MFGASTTLLNANHYDVYFKDMPIWNGKVVGSFSILIDYFMHYVSKDIKLLVINVATEKAWR